MSQASKTYHPHSIQQMMQWPLFRSATLGELLQKYEAIVTRTLRQNSCTRVDLIFDQCGPLSFKAGERKKRGEASSLEVNIHSGSTPILKQWTKLTSNPRNKERLAKFDKDKALEGVNNERSVTDKPQQPWRESCMTRISTERG